MKVKLRYKKELRIISFFLTFISVISLLQYSSIEVFAENRTIVQFNNTQLRDKVKEILSKPVDQPIYKDELLNIKDIAINNNSINSLEDIQYLSELETVSLTQNETLHDISRLKDLKNLCKLQISYCKSIDINTIGDLSNLTHLQLVGDQLSDMKFVENMTKLKVLILSENQIYDIIPVKKLLNLENLILNENYIEDVSSLESLVNIKSLILSKNRINDISSIRNLTNLEELYAEDNLITDIEALKNCKNLYRLLLKNNRIEKIDSLAQCSNLNYVRLEHNYIRNICAFENLSKLEYLNVCSNRITSIKPLGTVNSLRCLYLQGNGINDLLSLKNIYQNLCDKDFIVNSLEAEKTQNIQTKPSDEQNNIYAEKDKKWTSKSRNFFEDGLAFNIGSPYYYTYEQQEEYIDWILFLNKDNINVVPYTTLNKTMVPVNLVARKFGAEITWNENANIYTANFSDKKIIVSWHFGTNLMYVNGIKIELKVLLNKKNMEHFIPLEDLITALGYYIYKKDRVILIRKTPILNQWKNFAFQKAFNDLSIVYSRLDSKMPESKFKSKCIEVGYFSFDRFEGKFVSYTEHISAINKDSFVLTTTIRKSKGVIEGVQITIITINLTVIYNTRNKGLKVGQRVMVYGKLLSGYYNTLKARYVDILK